MKIKSWVVDKIHIDPFVPVYLIIYFSYLRVIEYWVKINISWPFKYRKSHCVILMEEILSLSVVWVAKSYSFDSNSWSIMLYRRFCAHVWIFKSEICRACERNIPIKHWSPFSVSRIDCMIIKVNLSCDLCFRIHAFYF